MRQGLSNSDTTGIWPITQLQREAYERGWANVRAREEMQARVRSYIGELGSAALDGIPVYRIAVGMNDQDPQVGPGDVRDAIAALGRDGQIRYDRQADTVYLS